MNTYNKLQIISSERLVDPATFSSIDSISDFRISTMMSHASLISGTSRNVPAGGPSLGQIFERKRQYLKRYGVEKAKKALMLFAMFDENKEIQALPLFPPVDGETMRHADIFRGYHEVEKGVFDTVAFPVHPDALGGEMYVIKDQKPTIALMEGRLKLPGAHLDALEMLSASLPEANIALARTANTFVVFEEGMRSEFTIDT